MKPAVVLLSGGLDSATTLAIAQKQGFSCYALSLDYGQRHVTELDAAVRVARALRVVEHQRLALDLSVLAHSALTDETMAVPVYGTTTGVPATYVPARNTIMLSLALAWAEVLHCQDVFIGVTAVDYSGYPDCRPDYICAFEEMANLATKAGREGEYFTIHAPLINLPKHDIIRTGIALGVDYGMTVSCYQADDAGRACGQCDACHLRRVGFQTANIPDPTLYQSTNIHE